MRILYLPNSHCQQRQFEKPNFLAYPVLMAMEAEWYREQGHEVMWSYKPRMSWRGVGFYGKCNICGEVADLYEVLLPNKDNPKFLKIEKLICEKCKLYDKVITEPENLPFLSLPHPDRVFTRWWEYQDNGNFKYHPGTYIISASGCWHGKCTFCVERGKEWQVRNYRDVIQEIEECQAMGFREIFDDSATFPYDLWKLHFWDSLEWRNKKWGNKGIKFSCNYRIVDEDYARLKRAGCRMLLFGVESANQATLDKIQKGRKVEDVKYIIKAAKAGLEPHIAVMFGYPWERDSDAINTLKLTHYLLRKGYAKTAQASFYTERGISANPKHKHFVRAIYDVAYSPYFWFNKIKDIRNIDDLKYLWRQIKVGLREGVKNRFFQLINVSKKGG